MTTADDLVTGKRGVAFAGDIFDTGVCHTPRARRTPDDGRLRAGG